MPVLTIRLEAAQTLEGIAERSKTLRFAEAQGPLADVFPAMS